MASKVRLFVDHPLGKAQLVTLTRDQSNYLFAVMRLPVDTVLSVINGVDGEWDATVIQANKKNGFLRCDAQTKPLQIPPDVWLVCAPIRKERMAFMVEKATELGVAKVVPILSEFTNTDRIRQEKLQAHAVEATEQCGGTYVPEVCETQKLADLLANWPSERQILFCDEVLIGTATKLARLTHGPWAIFIGPEGGFSDSEREILTNMPQATSISLGPRILRADTAAVAALTLWQSAIGDWG